MNLTPEERKIGRENYYQAVSQHDAQVGRPVEGVSRRNFLKEVIGVGAVSTLGLGAMYFGYQKPTNPVRVGVIGTGDEGNVLIGALNPDYVQVTAIADIRPSSIQRAFHGDWASPAAIAARPGLMSVYGWKSEAEARKHVKVYTDQYEELLKDKDVEAVIIALPLHLHAICAVKAMNEGKHVLCEKLMAHNVAQGKLMARHADDTGCILAVGHQRHYSILYDNAVNLIRWGVLGEIQHIRAQWHRGNLPGSDSWQQPVPGGETIWGTSDKVFDPIGDDLKRFQDALAKETSDPARAALLRRKIAQWQKWDADQTVQAKDYGYEDMRLDNGEMRTALEELVRWRLWERTGGGLMAELGSHQLDAASIFISALRQDGKKAHPLSLHAVGGRNVFPANRDADDQVYCMFEFPGPEYEPGFDVGYYDKVAQYPKPDEPHGNPNRRIVVTYSSINGNGYGGYGEVVMGSKGTLVLEREQEVMLYKDADTSTKVGVKADDGGAALDTQASGAGPVAQAAESTGPVSRGYTEEIEHWAWCIRNPSPENQPRCNPTVALGDAIMALSAKLAITRSQTGEGGYIKFNEDWFDVSKDDVPEVDYAPSSDSKANEKTIAFQKKKLGLS
ncbi:MAG: Gfo/Idh/MocA family oxidoreductase [Pirellulaceae bacterium]